MEAFSFFPSLRFRHSLETGVEKRKIFVGHIRQVLRSVIIVIIMEIVCL